MQLQFRGYASHPYLPRLEAGPSDTELCMELFLGRVIH